MARAAFLRASALGGTFVVVSLLGGCAIVAGLDKDYVFGGGDGGGSEDGGSPAEDAGADVGADAAQVQGAICASNHMVATRAMTPVCKQGLQAECCNDVSACTTSDVLNAEKNCVLAFQGCLEKCRIDIRVDACTKCLEGYPKVAQTFVQCAGRFAGLCDPNAIDYR